MPQTELKDPADQASVIVALVLAMLKELRRVPRGFKRSGDIYPGTVTVGGTMQTDWSGSDDEFRSMVAAGYLRQPDTSAMQRS